MEQDSKVCAECDSPMEAGTVADYRRNGVQPSEWVAGRAHSGLWTGKLENAKRYEIAAYRCTGCGLLKLYAAHEATSPDRSYQL
ncbi:MAG: hypothetical protein ACR2MQ_00150 [Gemmatimonadaceae bacterium]